MTQETSTNGGRQNTGAGGSPSAMDTATGTVREVASQAKDTAGQVAEQARQQATSQLSIQKDRAAEGLGSVAHALRQTSQQLQGQNQESITAYIDRAASQVDRFSTYLQQKDMRQMVDDVERFARRQPAMFLGGAFVLGILGARFLKSSSPQQARMGSYPITSRSDYSYTGGMYGQSYGSSVGAGTQSYERAVGAAEPARYGSPTAGATSFSTGRATTEADQSSSGSVASRRPARGAEDI